MRIQKIFEKTIIPPEIKTSIIKMKHHKISNLLNYSTALNFEKIKWIKVNG